MKRSDLWCVACLALLLAIGLGAPAFSQPPKGGPGGFFGGGGMGMMGGSSMLSLQLLQNEKVAKELELVDDQKGKIKELADATSKEMRSLFSGFQDMDADERAAKMKEFQSKAKARDKELTKKIGDILLAHQTERLDQISLQLRGVGALQDEKVQKALEITDAQKEKMRKIGQGVGEKMKELFQPGSDLSREERQKKMQGIQKEVADQTMEVLTAEQKEKLEKMKGPKFDISMQDLMPRRPPRPKE
jgi:Spy/CpxP family protein refolding chaperone